MTTWKRIGFWSGLACMFVCWVLSVSLDWSESEWSPETVRLAGVTGWMAIWWVSETVHLAVTGLIPLVAFPLLGIADARTVSPAYADRFILLLMGGFFVALCLERWDLHRRIALGVMAKIGTKPRTVVMSFMATTAVLSMWISNTATTLMMLPIAIAVLARLEKGLTASQQKGVGLALLLGIAYGASVGGMGTPIGTPPNGILMGQYEEMYPHLPTIGFLDWMIVAIPIVIVMLFFMWWFLVTVVGKIPKGLDCDAGSLLAEEREAQGTMSVAEKRVAWVFGATAFLWIFRKSIPIGDNGFVLTGWADWLGLGNLVHDSTVALASALVLFAMPSGEKERPRLLDWDTAVKIPWGLLLLFGGGLALATGFKTTGLTGLIGDSMRVMEGVPPFVLILVVCLLVTFLTEVTSNTATTSILVPILGASSVALGAHPLLLMIPATLSASCAFMLPVATAPNAVIFGSGKVPISDMARAGFWINVVGAIVIAIFTYLFGLPFLGALN